MSDEIKDQAMLRRIMRQVDNDLYEKRRYIDSLRSPSEKIKIKKLQEQLDYLESQKMKLEHLINEAQNTLKVKDIIFEVKKDESKD